MELPLLNFVSKKWVNVDLSNVLLISCQHVLGTTLDLYQQLFLKNLKPTTTYLIGKCYSTNNEVFERFQGAGVHISEHSRSYTSHQSFDEQFQVYIEEFFQEIERENDLAMFEKIVILDDGGMLLAYANDFLDDKSKVVGVEQTTSGFNRLSRTNFDFPVVNVARSKAKLGNEAQMIAELVVERSHKYLTSNNPSILVIGQGAVGANITNILRDEGYEVSGCDTDSQKCDFEGNYTEHLSEFDIIFGVTGEPVLVPGDFGKLKSGVYLISASSSDREFSAVYLRNLEEENSNCHEDYYIEDIHLVNSGFPINFTGEVHSLVPEKVQLTRALLLAGIFQAIGMSNCDAGFVDLSLDIQNELLSLLQPNV